ncbi:MAG: hypothetical protein EBQ96_07100 [Proteobacteria bacterium]|nr:hypothetical protein [Pseudomonadota bacterium]
MLSARLKDKHGDGFKVIRADEHTKHEYVTFAAEDRLCCTQCGGPAVHVRATKTNGGYDKVAHFRATHMDGCDYTENPHDAKIHESFKAALLAGKPILVNVNMGKDVVGFDGLSDDFNTQISDPTNGLMGIDVFRKTVGAEDYLSVPAHDIADVLHYLETAKELRGQAGLGQLWFNTRSAVQSCKRFVVSDRDSSLGQLVLDLARRANRTFEGRKKRGIRKLEALRGGQAKDTPRLFLFRVTDKQVEKAKENALHKLFGRAVDAVLPSMSGIASIVHTAIPGLLMKGLEGETLNNRTMLEDGRDFWVLATPRLSISRALQVLAKYERRRFSHVEPAFLMLGIKSRDQYMARGEKPAVPPITSTPTPTSSAPPANDTYVREPRRWQDRADLR